MKRGMSIFMLCSLVFLVTVGTTIAGNTDYGILEYAIQTPTVVDGMWTSPDEWTDSPITDMTGNATGQFGYNIDFGTYGLHWLVEIFTDNTTDEGDYWQICFDDQNTGGSAPDSGDFMIEIVGHTTMTVYQGNGAGWTEVTPDAGEITWSNTIDASPLNATPHWILEVVESDKTSGSVGIPTQPPTGMRIAAYDANTSTLATWAPDSSADVPDSWGAITGFSQEPIPEGLTFGVMAVISSVALLAGSHYLRKRAKLEE